MNENHHTPFFNDLQATLTFRKSWLFYLLMLFSCHILLGLRSPENAYEKTLASNDDQGHLNQGLATDKNGQVHYQKNSWPTFEPKKSNNESVFPERNTPDRIILTLNGNPAHQIGLSWRGGTGKELAFAEITKASAKPSEMRKGKKIIAKSQQLDIKGISSFHHQLSFDSLKPSTTYAYRVAIGDQYSEWFHFTTASDEEKGFSFLYFGDAQNEIKSLWSRVIRKAYSDMPEANFMLHAGDLIDGKELDEEWHEWFHAGSFIHAMIPSLPSPGNHEYNGHPEGSKRLNPYWKHYFNLPKNGPEGLQKTVYYVDYQGCRLISLDSQEILMSAESRQHQAVWLDSVLTDNPHPWSILFFHHPVYSTAKGRDNKRLREALEPIIQKHQVDLVLQGHDHTYARGQNLPVGVQNRDETFGTVYVVSVSGPKMYSQEKGKDKIWWDKGKEQTQLYQCIRVEPEVIRYQAYTALGEPYDAFEIQMDNSGKKQLVEMK